MTRDDGQPSFDEVVAAFIEHGIARSLQLVEDAMAQWHRRDATALHTHSIVMRHAARTSVFLEEVALHSARDRAGFLREAAIERLITPVQEQALLALTRAPDDDPRPAAAVMGSARVAIEPPTIHASGEATPTAIMNIARGLTNPDKSRVVGGLMGEGAVLVHIDARREGVIVPNHLHGQSKLVLRFGFGLSPAIADLVVDDQELSGTLTFGGLPFHCVLPWHAVYAAVVEGADKGHVWPEDVPELSFTSDPTEAASRDGAADRNGDRGGAVPTAPMSPTSSQSGPKKRPSHLRLVD